MAKRRTGADLVNGAPGWLHQVQELAMRASEILDECALLAVKVEGRTQRVADIQDAIENAVSQISTIVDTIEAIRSENLRIDASKDKIVT